MNILDNFLVHYLRRFDRDCFTVRLHDKTYTIGEGQPLFNIIINKDIPKKELLASTSLALGEAYMRKDVEIEGDLWAQPIPLQLYLKTEIDLESGQVKVEESSRTRER